MARGGRGARSANQRVVCRRCAPLSGRPAAHAGTGAGYEAAGGGACRAGQRSAVGRPEAQNVKGIRHRRHREFRFVRLRARPGAGGGETGSTPLSGGAAARPRQRLVRGDKEAALRPDGSPDHPSGERGDRHDAPAGRAAGREAPVGWRVDGRRPGVADRHRRALRRRAFRRAWPAEADRYRAAVAGAGAGGVGDGMGHLPLRAGRQCALRSVHVQVRRRAWCRSGATPIAGIAYAATTTCLQAVRSYVHNLNSHWAYEDFRDRRALLRRADRPIDGYDLAGELGHYSERRAAYVRIHSPGHAPEPVGRLRRGLAEQPSVDGVDRPAERAAHLIEAVPAAISAGQSVSASRETLSYFVAHGSRPAAGASARAPQERRAARSRPIASPSKTASL